MEKDKDKEQKTEDRGHMPAGKAGKTDSEKTVQEAMDYKDKYLRAVAEYDNLRKRFAKEKIELLQFGNTGIILELLPIIDDFDRAHEAAKQHKQGEVFSKGVEMILSQLHKLLKDNGVEKIKTVGEKFDPNIHEAVGAEETDKYPEDAVIEEVAPGYTLNGRLLRAAKVKIARKKTENKEEKNG